MSTTNDVSSTTFSAFCSALSLLVSVFCFASVSAAEDNWLPGSIANSGLTFVRPDTWAMGRSEVKNPTDEDKVLLLAVSFKPTPHVQFTWPVWVPAKSRRSVFLPMRSQMIKGDVRGVDATALLLDEQRHPPQIVRHPGLLRVDKSRPTTGMMQDRKDGYSADVATAMTAKVVGNKLHRRIFYLRDETLPPIFVGWQALDCLVIARDEPDLDSAQLAAIREWVISGGRLWVMAEQVNPAFMARLLGEDWTVQIVDHVALNLVKIDGGSDRGTLREFEVPVDMARLYAPGWEVVHEIRGWPASLRKRFGLGWVMLTAAGPRAWYETTWMTDKKTKLRTKRPKPLGPLQDLVRFYHRRLQEPPLPAEKLAEFASRRIGYSTLSRQPVAWILGLFTVGLAVVGLGLHLCQRLEHSAWVGVVLAVVAAGTLIAAGSINQGKVPLTLSEAQVAQVVPEQKHTIVNGALAIYSPEEDKGPLTAKRGGVVWPDLRSQGGELVRLQWTDLDKWVWDGVKLPKGAVLSCRFRHTLPFDEPAGVNIRFGPDGAVGTVRPGPFEQLEDMVLVTTAGSFAPKVEGDYALTMGPGEQLPPGEYLGGTTHGTLQQRRQELYKSLFEPKEVSVTMGSGARRTKIEGQLIAQTPQSVIVLAGGANKTIPRAEINRLNIRKSSKVYPGEPTLFAWTKALELGFELPQIHQLVQTALVAIPIRYRPTAEGTRVIVPAGFIPFETVRGPTGRGSPTIFDPKKREWIKTANGALLVLRFQLPDSVLPLQIEGGKWTFDLDAPGRTVESFHYGEKLLFSVPTQEQQELNHAAVSGTLRETFGKHGVTLSKKPSVSIEAEARWRISDQRRIFTVQARDDELDVYGAVLVEMAKEQSVIGQRMIDLAKFGRAIEIDRRGGILLALRVSDAKGGTNQWKVNRVQLEVTGQVGSQESEVASQGAEGTKIARRRIVTRDY